MTHIFVGKLTIIGSENGLAPGRRRAIFWTNTGILLIEPLGTNFGDISIRIQIFIQENALDNICEMASILSRPQCVKLATKGGCKPPPRGTWNVLHYRPNDPGKGSNRIHLIRLENYQWPIFPPNNLKLPFDSLCTWGTEFYITVEWSFTRVYWRLQYLSLVRHPYFLINETYLT